MVVVVPSKQAMTESPRPAAATLDVAGNTATTTNNNNPAHTNNNNNNTPPTSTHKTRQYPPHYNSTTSGGRNHHNGYYNNNNNRSHYHGHNSHYHHCTFPTPVINALANGVVDVNGGQQQQPARFCFGPGFEPQQNGFRGGGGYGVRGHSRGCAAGAAVAAASAAAAATSGQSVGAGGGGAESHVVLFHVNPGVTIRFQIGDSLEVLRGPVTVPMVSTNSSPPIAMPVQVPLGHVVQQIVDERGTLRHVILSPQHPANLVPMPPHQHYGDGTTNNNTNNPPPYGHPYSGNGGGVPPPASSISPNSGGGVGGLPGGYTHPHHHHHQSQPPPPLYHANMAPPPGGGGGGQPQQQHGSPTPGYYRDERAQRQFIKLRKKLHQRKGGGGGAVAMGNSTVRDTGGNSNSNVNTRIRKAPPSGGVVVTSLVKEKGMNSVGTSEDGEESSSVQDDEDSISLVTDMLSSVQAPTVSELSSRCALLQWSVPPAILDPTLITSSPSYTTTHSSSSSSSTNNTPAANNPDLDINPAELRYEVLLNAAGTDRDRGRCCYKSIYSGAALSCRIQDLRPGQEYAVCLQVHLDDELQGTASDPVRFTTPPCEPDQPHAPSLLQRKRNTLQLRWGGAAVNDNGSHIQHYILEVDDTSNPSTAGTFTEAHRGKGKQYTLQKLQAATTYRFRLAAVNECGPSAYSDIVAYTTMENPPPAPKPPLLAEATVHTLLLHWERGVADRRYTLEMAEAEDGGYLPRYNGDSTEYKCDQLLTCTEYRFRLLAGNDGGNSPWSEEVRYCTRPDQPSRPSKPVVKGRINAHSFRLCWEPPSNTGGTTISKYILEVNSGSGYETIYNGPNTEATCDRLTPGTTYQLRVSCLSSGGQSDHSDPCTVTTDAICPGQCPPPVVTTPAATAGRVAPAARYVTLRLTPPDYNGGAPVLEYEVQLTGGGRNAEVVYKRKEMECMIVDLLPGTQYSFLVRGVNRIGAGVWSEPLTITTASIPPEPPTELTVTARTAHHVFVEWSDSECYGSPITEYRLEMFTQQQFEEGSSANATTVYQGPAKSHDLKSLTPDTTYHLRCSAANTLGYSSPCPPVPITTPPSAPGCPSPPRVTPTPRSLHVTWTAPPAHGSPITHYQLDFVGDNHPQTFTIPVATVEDEPAAPLEFLLEDLTPETVYKVRVQAHNGIGAGVYSGSARVSTLTPPPKPPRLECVQVSHNYVKMRWGGESVGAAAKRGGSTEELFTTYHLELLSPFAPHEYQCVFKGTQKTFKVNKLQEAVCYTFRICASNDAGGCGDYSDELEVNTSIAPPVGLRVPKLVETDVEQRCCTIEWQTSRNVANDETSYLVQVTKAREQDYKEVYKGSATKHTLTHLDPSTEYLARVCPIRLCATASGELPGPFSPPLSINLTATISTTSKSSSSSNNNTLSSGGGHNNGTTGNPQQRQQIATSTNSARSHHHHHHRASNKSTSVRLREWVKTTAETYKVMLISLLVVVVSCGLAMVLYTPAE